MSLKNLNVTIKIPKLLEDNLKNKKINKIYKSFEKTLNINENFIVGVSGGPDSLALAFLAKIFAIKKKLKVKFFIVNHNLRSNSAIEAKLVKRILKKQTINSQILTWHGKKPTKNIQSLARKKRYELLFKECDKFKANNVLLGHHQNDLFENFFIRILRGSGLKGLISLGQKSKIENKNLLRPLINHKKEDLIFLAKKVFDFYVNDPSNEDQKYQRIKIRSLIKELQLNGLDRKKFNNTIKNLKNSNNVIDFYVGHNLKNNSFFSMQNKKLILNKEFFEQPYEIVFRSLSASIRSIGKKYYPVRGRKLDRVILDIEKNRLLRLTLGGCVIEKVSQTVIISKEY